MFNVIALLALQSENIIEIPTAAKHANGHHPTERSNKTETALVWFGNTSVCIDPVRHQASECRA